jgi:hypothetical protein
MCRNDRAEETPVTWRGAYRLYDMTNYIYEAMQYEAIPRRNMKQGLENTARKRRLQSLAYWTVVSYANHVRSNDAMSQNEL